MAVGAMLAGLPAARSQEAPADDVGRQNAIIVATLVRATLVALDQASVTGNYTVLRDLAASGFRDAHTAADLARIFAPIRAANIDLDAVVVLDPRLTSAPAIDDNGMLRIEGTFDTQPNAIAFQFLFEAVDNDWRLFGLSVNPIKPTAETTAATEPPEAGLIGPAILPQSLVPPMPRTRPPAAPPQ